MSTLGDRILFMRLRHDWTRSQLAEQAKLSLVTVQSAELGRATPYTETVRLC